MSSIISTKKNTKKTTIRSAATRTPAAAARTAGRHDAPACADVMARTPLLVQRRVAGQLLERRDTTGRGLASDDYAPFVASTGRSERQLRRWVKAELARRAADTLAEDAPDRADKAAARRALAGQRARFELTDQMLTVLAAAPSVYEAWLFLRYQDTESLVHRDQVSKSTFYEAVNRLPAAVRLGLRHGSDAVRDVSPHLPRDISRLGQSYSYDLKNLRVACVHDDGEIHSDNWLLAFRDEATSLVVGRLVLPYVPNDAEVAACFAEAVRGWTLDGITIAGAPMLLRTDNGANLNGPQMRRAQVLTGAIITPSESYESAGNGRHERMHADLDRELSALPGYTRGPLKRGGKTYAAAGDLVTFDQLSGFVYDALDRYSFEHRPDTARHAGRTPFEMARDLLAAGEHDLTDVPDELLAPLGLPLPSRVYNLNEGTLTWDTQAYHHPDLAERGDSHYTGARLPLDDTIVFVIGADGRYVTTAVRVRDLTAGLRNRTVRERKERERLVDRHQAAAARLAAAPWTHGLAGPAGPNPEPPGEQDEHEAVDQVDDDVTQHQDLDDHHDDPDHHDHEDDLDDGSSHGSPAGDRGLAAMLAQKGVTA